ncbi:MAG: hypothetical protein SFY68_01390 [Candidatus Sumerlaeia bacterium]|nr:hypothetical protein [Candidatus Sumerlaeia bacterium]
MTHSPFKPKHTFRALLGGALFFFLIPSGVQGHAGHEHSPFLELTDAARSIQAEMPESLPGLRLEAWYDPTPLGKRSRVLFKIFDGNRLNPKLLKHAYIQAADTETSYTLKIEADPELPESYVFVRALPLPEPQDIILHLQHGEGISEPILIKGFAPAESDSTPKSEPTPASQPTTAVPAVSEKEVKEIAEPAPQQNGSVLRMLLIMGGVAGLVTVLVLAMRKG